MYEKNEDRYCMPIMCVANSFFRVVGSLEKVLGFESFSKNLSCGAPALGVVAASFFILSFDRLRMTK